MDHFARDGMGTDLKEKSGDSTNLVGITLTLALAFNITKLPFLIASANAVLRIPYALKYI
jgi:hypothetical protein